MSARGIRRSFAAPFVLTIATIAPAIADTPKPAPTKNPPAPQPPINKNPPPPKKPEPPKPEPAKFERHWQVMKDTAKGAKATDCLAMPQVECPKAEPGKPVPTCNPPAPSKYTCPTGFSDKDKVPFKIILRVGATECFQEREPMSCPKGETCNPPPPRKLECPH